MLHVTESKLFDEGYVDDKANIKIGKNTKVEVGSVIYDNCTIGQNSIIGTGAVLKSNTILNDHSIIGTLARIEGDTKIGSWTTVYGNCQISDAIIGNCVFMGPCCITTNTPGISLGKFGYPNTTNDPRLTLTIEDGVRMGASVLMAPGITIGKNSLIDMGCLVTKDVPPNSHVRAGKDIIGRVIGQIDST